MYDYLNCLGISPCRGWMNSNATLRNITDQWAANLTAVYPQIVKQYANSGRWKAFQLYYVRLDFSDIISEWVQSGGAPSDLIEPVDGFHPSQVGDTLLAAHAVKEWDLLGILPPVNPNNAKIAALFGDQGGY